jgi:hypothetical protein
MKPLDKLNALALEENRRKYPNFPDKQRYWGKYSDKTANGLTKCILDYINLSGGKAERISVTGRYKDNTKVVTDCIGRKYKVGTAQYIPSSMEKGSADISSTIPTPKIKHGLSVKWEVKMKDKQSEAQKNYQASIERAGGFYFIVHSFEEFLYYYELLLNEEPF